MNVSGLPSSLQSLLATREQLQAQRPDAQGAAAAQAQRATTGTAVPPTPAKQAGGVANANLTAQPPEGTDPALWSVLTSDERAFFSRVVTSGPLTYSKMAAANTSRPAAMPSIRGGRIDFRA